MMGVLGWGWGCMSACVCLVGSVYMCVVCRYMCLWCVCMYVCVVGWELVWVCIDVVVALCGRWWVAVGVDALLE